MNYRFRADDPYGPPQPKPTRVARNAMIGMLVTFVVVALLFFVLGDIDQRARPDGISGPNYAQAKQEYTRQLTTYGWVDRSAGTVRIPIERAIQLTAERGLPSRPSQ